MIQDPSSMMLCTVYDSARCMYHHGCVCLETVAMLKMVAGPDHTVAQAAHDSRPWQHSYRSCFNNSFF